MDLVKEILMWIGVTALAMYALIGLYYLAVWIIDKFTARVIKGVNDNLQVTGVRGAKGDKWDNGLLDVDELCNHCIMMVVNGTWQTVNLEEFIKSYIDIVNENKEKE